MIFRQLFDTKQKFHCKKFRWKYIENENRQYYLSNKKQKSMFPIASPMDARLVLCTQFLLARSIAQLKFKFI